MCHANLLGVVYMVPPWYSLSLIGGLPSPCSTLSVAESPSIKVSDKVPSTSHRIASTLFTAVTAVTPLPLIIFLEIGSALTTQNQARTRLAHRKSINSRKLSKSCLQLMPPIDGRPRLQRIIENGSIEL